MDNGKKLENKFNQEMLLIYERAKSECKYNATRFLGMVTERGGLQAAKILLNAKHLSGGFVELWKCHRLDLTVEALVLQPEWKILFSDEERVISKKRLDELGYKPK